MERGESMYVLYQNRKGKLSPIFQAKVCGQFWGLDSPGGSSWGITSAPAIPPTNPNSQIQNPNPKSRTQHPKSRIPPCQTQNTDPKSKIPNPKSKPTIQNPTPKISDTPVKPEIPTQLQNPKSKIQSQNPEPNFQNLGSHRQTQNSEKKPQH